MSTTIIDQAITAPTPDQLERALAELIHELMTYRRRRERRRTNNGKPIVAITDKALMETPSGILDAIDWADAPVERALKDGMHAVAQIIFDQLGSTNALRGVVERICARSRHNESERLGALDLALDGVGNERDRWWA
jgi:hypothetical protein